MDLLNILIVVNCFICNKWHHFSCIICNYYWSINRNSKNNPDRSCKKLIKTSRNLKKKHNKVVILAKSKLNSIESKISEALINSEISYEDFMIIINGEKNSRIKESITMMNSKRSHTGKTEKILIMINILLPQNSII